MKNILTTIILVIFIPFIGIGQYQPVGLSDAADQIIGDYELPNGIWVSIYRQGHYYKGKIISVENYIEGETLDVKNPSRHLRNQSLVGLEILSGLVYDDKYREWINGELYAPEKGMTVKLRIEKVDTHEIVVVGSKLLFVKTLTWQRLR